MKGYLDPRSSDGRFNTFEIVHVLCFGRELNKKTPEGVYVGCVGLSTQELC